MNIFTELAIVLTISMVGEGIAKVLPFTLPASVVSLILLIIFLLTGIVREGHIKKISAFFTGHMTLFFVPSCIGIMQYFDLIGPQFIPFLLITVLTTPLIYGVTGWTVQLMIRWMDEKEANHD